MTRDIQKTIGININTNLMEQYNTYMKFVDK